MENWSNLGQGLVMVAVLGAVALKGQAQTLVPQAPEVQARAYLLLDVAANQVLAQSNADAPIEPASLTKLMTAYLVFDALKHKKISLDQKYL